MSGWMKWWLRFFALGGLVTISMIVGSVWSEEKVSAVDVCIGVMFLIFISGVNILTWLEL